MYNIVYTHARMLIYTMIDFVNRMIAIDVKSYSQENEAYRAVALINICDKGVVFHKICPDAFALNNQNSFKN